MPDRLEAMMHVVAFVPVESGTAVAQALVQRHGLILSREHRGDKHVIRARAPEGRMLDFWSELSTLTGGLGTFSMVAFDYRPAADAPPPGPEAGVREPRPCKPGGRTDSIALAEPAFESDNED